MNSNFLVIQTIDKKIFSCLWPDILVMGEPVVRWRKVMGNEKEVRITRSKVS